MALHQTFKDGVLVEEKEVPDEVIPLTPDEERIAALEAQVAALITAIGTGK